VKLTVLKSITQTHTVFQIHQNANAEMLMIGYLIRLFVKSIVQKFGMLRTGSTTTLAAVIKKKYLTPNN